MKHADRHSKIRKSVTLAAMMAFAAPVASVHAAGRVFFDNFESGNTNAWSADTSGNKCTATRTSVDQRAPRSGSYMAECNWNGVVAWNDPQNFSALVLRSWDYSREFLIRFWFRYSSDVDRKMGNKLMRLLSQDGSHSFYVAAQMERTNGPLFVYWESMGGRSGPLSYGDGTVAGDGNWHKVEIYMKHNNAGQSDGVVKVWLDGSIVSQGTNLVTASSGARWYPFYLMSNWSNNPGWEHDANNHVYWDDVEVFSDTGSGASGSMADATISVSGGSAPSGSTPSAPGSLTVR